MTKREKSLLFKLILHIFVIRIIILRMFVRLSASIHVNTLSDDICASPVRPVLYTIFDRTIYEVSLDNGERDHQLPKKIYQMGHGTSRNIACDHQDRIYISWSIPYVSTHIFQLSPPGKQGDTWTCREFPNINECPIPRSLQLSHYGFHKNWFSSKDEIDSEYSYINDNILCYFDGQSWSKYTLMGKTTSVRPFWISSYRKEKIFCCVNDHSVDSQIWVTRGDYAVLLLTTDTSESLWMYYSPITNAIYTLSHVITEHITDQYVSIFQFEVPTLFHLCSQVINRDDNLFNRVIPCLQEGVKSSQTERERGLTCRN